MFGERLKELREAKGYVQRQVAAELELDTAYISKMESNDKPASRSHLKKLSKLYSIPEAELLPLWIGEKILQVVQEEKYAIEALEIVLDKLKETAKKK